MDLFTELNLNNLEPKQVDNDKKLIVIIDKFDFNLKLENTNELLIDSIIKKEAPKQKTGKSKLW